jgi:hypothetical protein
VSVRAPTRRLGTAARAAGLAAALLSLPPALCGCDESGPPREAQRTDCCGVHWRIAAAPHAPVPPPAPATMLDAATPDDPRAAQRARGEYLVRHVGGCMECHTPRLPTGAFDESKLLSGVENFTDVEPDDDARGLLHSRNLTPDEETGLGKWTDVQIRRAFQQGVDDENKPLHWTMPYWIFRNMNSADAGAIVAYLRSIPKVVHRVPERQPTAIDGDAPFRLAHDDIPDTTLAPGDPNFASARRGRYIATALAPCALCHSPADPTSAHVPIHVARMFTGRRRLAPAKLGTRVDPGTPLIESINLTPSVNGIGEWTAMDVANAVRKGVGRGGMTVCDPMPSYYGGSFLGITEQDALDLGHYFTTIAPHDSGPVPKCCTACHRGGEMQDAGRD